ncbi:MAG: c-type cytochrome [Anaerolineales bacterium]|nr:c-type cytochrome [Anaerolineales bacterium]
MVSRKRVLRFTSTALIYLGLAACAPPRLLPEGPTPIPTLIPVTEISGPSQPTETPPFAVLSYPARPPSAAEGEKIYATYCAECHGEDGSGTVPAARNFRDLDYMRGEVPADFYAAVTEGRGSMPGYKETLSSDERWDSVFFVWRLSTSAETMETGRKVYDKNCASCHGEDGSGELLGSANFTDLRQMDNLAPRDLYLVTTQGRGSMPAMQSLLSQDDRWAVIDYIRSFSYDPTLSEEVGVDLAAETQPSQPTEEVACATDQTNLFAWEDPEAVQAGQTIYLIQCAMCHGPDGSGGIPNTPDFTSEEVSISMKADPSRTFCSVSEGLGSMPAFGESLSEEEKWQVITYMGSLGPNLE